MNLSVGFDAEKIKHPNTGLNTFCYQLALALQQECNSMENTTFKVYLPPTVKNYFNGAIKEHIYRFYDRRLLFLPGRIWHQPFQGGRFFPRGVRSTLLTIHDLNYLYEKGGKYREREERIVQKRINRSDRIVAISEYTKNDILKYLDTQGKPIDVIYNGCSTFLAEITPPRDIPEKPFLFNVGTILSKKNIHVLPAILRGNDYLLYLAGNRSSYEKEIWSNARKHGVENRIRIIGSISESEKHWYFKHCEAFLFPSIAEGFGLPVIEAMQYGKPCFLSQHTCLPEIGSHHAYYFNYDFDPDLMLQEFEAGMHHFATQGNPQHIIEHSQKFTWQKAAQAYWKIYREMAL